MSADKIQPSYEVSSSPDPDAYSNEPKNPLEAVTSYDGMTAQERFPNIDEKKVLRKMDMHLLPMLAVLYLLSFLDRGNIGNAKIEGLVEDLGLSNNQYNLCLTIFFITYSLFEVPSNMCLKLLRPSIWIPTIMIAWGVVMTLMGIVHNFAGLFACRLFLGVAEAGLFPGVAYILTMWYCKGEIQFRQAMFFSAASVAGAFSGLLAFGISKMDGVAGLEGWRWIFILEGILTVLVAFGSFWGLQDFPETASFLTPEEREFVLWRLANDSNKAPGGEAIESRMIQYSDAGSRVPLVEKKLTPWQSLKQVLSDWQCWLHLIVYYSVVVPLYGISLFLPTIILNLGYTSAKAQLMTVPIYIAASIASVTQAWFSDRVGLRSPFILVNLLFLVVGYSMCVGTDPKVKPGVIYGGSYLIALGVYPAFPGVISWNANNLAGSYKRAVGMAFHIGIGNFGGAFASNIYRAQDKPRFILGHSMELGFISLGLCGLTVLVTAYRKINAKREKELQDGKWDGYTREEIFDMGDKSPLYRYRL
ncbi:hypothetical protein BABINDRAFT_163606 [Babjeviella inositovora NRRL Y-12698]|uniref:Major facilitator superfamily (MFS) profile domain-containing protein n=1 Tax=Babjeviella inositovora NRRL Y-12698 TaxID=984486 RepID=A0A1E3QI85_9ASCO|nr:uncharacterized protein BABINDRAFT_163606 [Babjeviella inositovora NRRL Y-12698]ODQ77350.1 hypothetical protein BABINDRAFT_163606 [Babjeviella inositovora NRRL Y-12698]